MSIRIAASDDWNLPPIDGCDVVSWERDTPRDVDIVVAPHSTPRDIVEQATPWNPRLIQLGSIGYDAISRDLPAGTVVANAASVHETSTAEHTVAMLLFLARDLPRSYAAQRKHVWDTFHVRGLADSRVLIIGAGGVGRAIAERLSPFEVDIARLASRERDDDLGHIDGPEMVADRLAWADAVIVVVPHNDSTHHLINDEFLSAMKDDAILINVARGLVADTDALLAHARRLRIGLDVTDPEPLPDGHPLFGAASLITAHNGGNADAMLPRMASLVRQQVGAIQSGTDFVNVVLS